MIRRVWLAMSAALSVAACGSPPTPTAPVVAVASKPAPKPSETSPKPAASAEPRVPVASFVADPVMVPPMRWKADPPAGVSTFGPPVTHGAVPALSPRETLSAEEKKRAYQAKEALRVRASACVEHSKDVTDGNMQVAIERDGTDAPPKIEMLGLAVLAAPDRACLERAILSTFESREPAVTLSFVLAIREKL